MLSASNWRIKRQRVAPMSSADDLDGKMINRHWSYASALFLITTYNSGPICRQRITCCYSMYKCGALLELKAAIENPAGDERSRRWRSAGAAFRGKDKDRKAAAPHTNGATGESNSDATDS